MGILLTDNFVGLISNFMPGSLIKTLLFRSAFIFFVLYIFFNPNGFFPYSDEAYNVYIIPFHQLIAWTGRHILHLPYPITTFTNGSGDTSYDYLMLALTVLLTLVGAGIWTIIDLSRPGFPGRGAAEFTGDLWTETPDDTPLRYWLIALVRYYLAFTLFNYGFAKVFRLQFPSPGPYSLFTSYGQSSPMHLAWNFFGYSPRYNYFTGMAEIVSGALLLFRRTLRLGAILSLAVAANIMAVNYCFDVCVKLLSTILVIMAIFLLWQERRRHLHFFFPDKYNDYKSTLRALPPPLTPPVFMRGWVNKSLVYLKYLLILFVLYMNIANSVKAARLYGPSALRPPLYGAYDVKTYILNNDTLAPLTTDTTRWRKLLVWTTSRAAIKGMNDSVKIFVSAVDTVKKKLVLYPKSDTAKKSWLHYRFIGEDSLVLQGKWKNDSVLITLKKLDTDSLLLVRRGFHFINEVPFNR